MLRLSVRQTHRTRDLVSCSYDRIAGGYDRAWTSHMRDRTRHMLDRLNAPAGAACVDLACGTGFASGQLASRTGGRVIGVDRSAGMLDVARSEYGKVCRFIQADAVEYLRSLPSGSVDVVTCAWGLGYSRPLSLVRETARVLRSGGRIGIIDNTLFSLAEVLSASLLAFAEYPEALQHVMRVQFLPSSVVLATIMRCCGLAVREAWDGSERFMVPDGRAAIDRLTATGAAAGFEFAADDRHRDEIFAAFARVLDARRRSREGVPIVHRYLAAVGRKP
jgi:SAM-dependent methyltransferase